MHPPAQDSDDAAKKAFVSDKFPFRMRLLLVLAAAIPFLIFFKFPVENVESKGNIKSANANTVGSKFIITNNDDYEDDADSDDDVEEDAKENDREDKTKTQETLENSKKSTSTASPSLINHNGTTSLDFVLHVGLAKTGTTSIQGALGMSLYQHMVEKDNYYFLGKTRGLGPKKKWGPKERAMVDKDVVRMKRL